MKKEKERTRFDKRSFEHVKREEGGPSTTVTMKKTEMATAIASSNTRQHCGCLSGSSVEH